MITFCIPSKNNLRYLKASIPSIQKNSLYKNNILVFVDQDNDGTEDWLKENNIDYILNTEPECKGIGYAYDIMFQKAKTDLVIAFHADMILGPFADQYLLELHERGKVVCATCIEPPGLHPPGIDKLIAPFGMWPEQLDIDGFNEYVTTLIKEEKPVTHTMFAPWLIDKRDHIMHDPIFLSVFEDSDLFRRFKLAGYQLLQSWKSYVYHLTCRGGQFEHANTDIDLNVRSSDWKRKSDLSALEYIRKWGGLPKSNELNEPITNKKYNVAFVVKNSNIQILEALEPWCDRIYLDDEMQVITSHYIEKEQTNTKFDLSKRILITTLNDPKSENDIVLEFDARHFTQNSYNIIQNLSDIITESGEVGEFELDIFKISIQNLESYEKDLIYVKI